MAVLICHRELRVCVLWLSLLSQFIARNALSTVTNSLELIIV